MIKTLATISSVSTVHVHLICTIWASSYRWWNHSAYRIATELRDELRFLDSVPSEVRWRVFANVLPGSRRICARECLDTVPTET